MGNHLQQFFGSVKIHAQKHVVKHTLKLKNISVYYYLQKTSLSIKMSEEGQC